MRAFAAILAVGAALLGAQSAQAVRYASPTGSASASCATPADACDLRTAVEGKAKNEPAFGETVVVEPGTYHVTATVRTGAGNMTVEGEAGHPRPVLQGSTGQLIRTETGGSIAYLEVNQEGSGEAVFADNATLDRLRVTGAPSGEMLCQCYGGLIRDSVFVAKVGSTGGAVGVNSNGGTATETLRNDTIYSESKEAPAIWLNEQTSSGSLAMTVINTIALNALGGHDVEVSESSTITLDHSDYASPTGEGTIKDTGGHVTSVPLFSNLGEGDFREQAASPTIDAGVTEAEDGAVDYEGGARTLGASTDIGAFEYVPPAAGETPPGSGPPPPDGSSKPGLAPVITEARLSASAFRAASRGNAFAVAHRPPMGATLSWNDSESATTTLRLTRLVPGHRKGRSCAAGKPKGRQRPCRRSIAVTSFTHSDAAGANSQQLTGRAHNRRLPSGSYILTLTPATGGLTGMPVTLRLRIL